MATNETAKPCPSTERKKAKVVILKEVLGRAAAICRVLILVDTCWDWVKDHWKVFLDWFAEFL